MGYENSKVYKLQHEDGHFYIGSTYAELRERFRKHKEHSIEHPDRRVYKHINNQWDNVRILLIEEFPCENKQQLLRREDEHIQKELKNPLCLNCIGATFNVEKRRDYVQNYNSSYYEEHKHDILEQKKARKDEINARRREVRALKKPI
jgi:predicted GIY-YIG superfamily endonuclease